MKRIFIILALVLCGTIYLATPRAFAEEPRAAFALENKDILEWQAGPYGKYIYFKMSPHKGDELTQTTTVHQGGSIDFIINGKKISSPKIPNPINGRGGMAIGGKPEMIADLKAGLDPAVELGPREPSRLKATNAVKSKTPVVKE
jgi:hypothetical protein